MIGSALLTDELMYKNAIADGIWNGVKNIALNIWVSRRPIASGLWPIGAASR